MVKAQQLARGRRRSEPKKEKKKKDSKQIINYFNY